MFSFKTKTKTVEPAPDPKEFRKGLFEQAIDREAELRASGDLKELCTQHAYLFAWFSKEHIYVHLPDLFTDECPCGFNHMAGRPSLKQGQKAQDGAGNPGHGGDQ